MLSVMTVAISIFAGMVVASARQRSINREASLAAEAARMTLESIRNVPFERAYVLYNDDSSDDPAGMLAPGAHFVVGDLRPVEGDADGFVGRVVFPDARASELAPLELREDSDETALSMPRDLNGDSLIDDFDHADNYYLLPVRVEVEWDGVLGRRVMAVNTTFTRWERVEGDD